MTNRIGTSAPLLDDEVEIIAAEDWAWSRPLHRGRIGRVDGLDEIEVLVDFGDTTAVYRRQNLRVTAERIG